MNFHFSEDDNKRIYGLFGDDYWQQQIRARKKKAKIRLAIVSLIVSALLAVLIPFVLVS
ncbi:hypothetical protein L1D59_09335 [Pseudoalteromonas piscicida]|uniref:hypothetical protein n=1 Tax=Pseudoalteromonas piscicida TaxID=43662 RepID=UPI001EFC8B8E|nr:hypothetical protein [Pseudoalteromonas piscicida]MCG9768814.1 hypothetical protein [Pseudoalteromonas piscicida]